MKKNIFTSLVAVLFFTSAFASENSDVIFKVLNSFRNDFSNVNNLSWKITNNYVRASFVIGSEKMDAFYTNDGILMGTSKPIAFDKLPTSAIRKITKKYQFPPYTLKECFEVTDADGEVNYYISLLGEKQNTTILKINSYGQLTTFQ